MIKNKTASVNWKNSSRNFASEGLGTVLTEVSRLSGMIRRNNPTDNNQPETYGEKTFRIPTRSPMANEESDIQIDPD